MSPSSRTLLCRVLVTSVIVGIFKTTNAGTTWAPLFDHQAVLSISAIALTNDVWRIELNGRRSL